MLGAIMKVSSVMLGESKRKPKSPSRRTSRNEEKERKGRCRLDFSASSEKKPLEGMKIFLDIPSQKIAQMTAQVIQLGGKVEDFVSKEISLIVTSKGINCRGDGAAQSPSPLSTASPNNPLSNKSKSAGISPFSNDSPHYSVESGKNRLPSANQFSRAGKMLSMVSSTSMKKSCSTGRDVVAQAKRFGAKAISLEDFSDKYLGKHGPKEVDLGVLKSKRTTSTDTVRSSRHHSVAQIQVTRLAEPFVKIEIKSRKYRPIFYEIKKWPKLYLDETNYVKDCPFDVPEVNRSTRKLQNAAEMEEGCPSVAERSDEGGSVKEEKPRKEDKQDRKGKRNERNVAGGAAPRKISYCDCCCVRYADLKKHIRSEKHRQFARNADNYKDLDQLLSRGAPFSEFLNILENNTRSRESSRCDQESSLTSPLTPSGKNQKSRKKDDNVHQITHENLKISPKDSENKENETQCIGRRDEREAIIVDQKLEMKIPYVSQKDEKVSEVRLTKDILHTSEMLNVNRNNEKEDVNITEREELEPKGISEEKKITDKVDEYKDEHSAVRAEEEEEEKETHLTYEMSKDEVPDMGYKDEKHFSNDAKINQIEISYESKNEVKLNEKVCNELDDETLTVSKENEIQTRELIDLCCNDEIENRPLEKDAGHGKHVREEECLRKENEVIHIVQEKKSVKNVTFADDLLPEKVDHEAENIGEMVTPHISEVAERDNSGTLPAALDEDNKGDSQKLTSHMVRSSVDAFTDELPESALTESGCPQADTTGENQGEFMVEVNSLNEIVKAVDESLNKIVSFVESDLDEVFLDAELSLEKKGEVRKASQSEEEDGKEGRCSIDGLPGIHKETAFSHDTNMTKNDEDMLPNLDDGLDNFHSQLKYLDSNLAQIVQHSPAKSHATPTPSQPQSTQVISLISPPSPQQPPSPSLWSGGSRSSQGSPSASGKAMTNHRKKSKKKGGISRILLLSPQPKKSDVKTNLESSIDPQSVTERKPRSPEDVVHGDSVEIGSTTGPTQSSSRNRCKSTSAQHDEDKLKAEVRSSPRLQKQRKDKDSSKFNEEDTSGVGTIAIAADENSLGAEVGGNGGSVDAKMITSTSDLNEVPPGKHNKGSGKEKKKLLERKAYEMRRSSSENKSDTLVGDEQQVSKKARAKATKKKKKTNTKTEQDYLVENGEVKSAADVANSTVNVVRSSEDVEGKVKRSRPDTKKESNQPGQIDFLYIRTTGTMALRQSPQSQKQKGSKDVDKENYQKQLVKEVTKEDKKTSNEVQKSSRTKKACSTVIESSHSLAASLSAEVEIAPKSEGCKIGSDAGQCLSPRSLKELTAALDVPKVSCSSPRMMPSEFKMETLVEDSPISARVEQIKHSIHGESSACDTSTEPYAISMLGHTVNESAGEISQMSAEGKVCTTSASSADGEMSTADAGNPPQIDSTRCELPHNKKAKDHPVRKGQANQSMLNDSCKPMIEVRPPETPKDEIIPQISESPACDISTEPYAMYSMSEIESFPIALGAKDDAKPDEDPVCDSGDNQSADELSENKSLGCKADNDPEGGKTKSGSSAKVEDLVGGAGEVCSDGELGRKSKPCTLEVRTLCVISSIKDESFTTQAYEDHVKSEVKKETNEDCKEIGSKVNESLGNISPTREKSEPDKDTRDNAAEEEMLPAPGLVSSTPCKHHTQPTLIKEALFDSSSRKQNGIVDKVELDFSLQSSFGAHDSPGHRAPSMSQDLFDRITAIACKENLSPICRRAKRGNSERKRALSRTLDKTLEGDVGQDEDNSENELRKILRDAAEDNMLGGDIFESSGTQKSRTQRTCVKKNNLRCQSETTCTRPRRQAFTKASESLASEMFSKLDETPEKSFDNGDGSDGAWLFNDPAVQQIINFRSPGGGASSRKRRVAAGQIMESPTLQDLGLADLVEKISEDNRKAKKKKKKKKKRLEFGNDEIFPEGRKAEGHLEGKIACDVKVGGTAEKELNSLSRTLGKTIPKPQVSCDGSDLEMLQSDCSDQAYDSDDIELSKLSRANRSSNPSVLQVNDIFTPESKKNVDAKCASDVESPRRKSRKTSCNEKGLLDLNDTLDDDVFALKHEDDRDDCVLSSDEELNVSLVTLIKVKRRSCQSKRKVVSPTELSRERKKSRNNNEDRDLLKDPKVGNKPRTPNNVRLCENKRNVDMIQTAPSSCDELRANNTAISKDSIAHRLSLQSTPAECSSSKQKRSYSERTREETEDSSNIECVRTGNVGSHQASKTAEMLGPKYTAEDGSEKKKYCELRTKPPRGLTSPISTNFDSDDSFTSQPSSGIFFKSPSRSSKRIQSAKETADRSKSLTSKKVKESTTQRLKSFPPHTNSSKTTCESVELSPVEEDSVPPTSKNSKRSKHPKSTPKPRGKTKISPGINAIAFSKASFKKGTLSLKSGGNTCPSDSPSYSTYEFTGS